MILGIRVRQGAPRRDPRPTWWTLDDRWYPKRQQPGAIPGAPYHSLLVRAVVIKHGRMGEVGWPDVILCGVIFAAAMPALLFGFFVSRQ
jgi:hypothetical protein